MALITVLIHWVLWSYLAVLTVRMVLSVLPLLVREWEPRGVLLVIAEFTYTLTDPPLRFLRRFIPTLRLGDLAVDLSFIVLYFGLSLLLRWLPL
jgi:YggT family protein